MLFISARGGLKPLRLQSAATTRSHHSYLQPVQISGPLSGQDQMFADRTA